MPAQSPTLSPTLSAMVAGLRGSSSGMPASTLPTRSPPTSAPLVKMPPPRRAKIEISEAPKPSATMRVDHGAAVRRQDPGMGQIGEIDGDAEQRETGDQHAGDRAGLEGQFESAGERGGRRLRGAHIGAHRDVHADEAGRARQHRADQEADRDQHAEEIGQQHEDHDADDADRGVLALADRPARPRARPPRFPACADCRHRRSSPTWSPRWRRRWKALRRAQSPIMLSLNLPQILVFALRHGRGRRQAHKKEPALPKRAASNRPGPCQNRIPGATPRRAKTGRISKGFCVETASVFAKMLEMAVGQRAQRDLPALRVEKPRTARPGDDRADRRSPHIGCAGRPGEGRERVLRHRA